MTEAWKSYPGAPPPGTRLCALSDIPGSDIPGSGVPGSRLPVSGPVAVHAVDLDGFGVILLNTPEGLRAYVNACPHQFLPLTWRRDRILSADGGTLRCSNHDAGFDADTGQGIDGLAQGCWLDPVPIAVQGADVVIA